ncbi:hypothetical protein [Comamonas sp. 4034]|uniref:hypothetical protein n=1 Tax=Comamonas sp. 4034 TaxID=3156455 RepID=UPI003D1AD801
MHSITSQSFIAPGFPVHVSANFCKGAHVGLWQIAFDIVHQASKQGQREEIVNTFQAGG